MTPNKQITSTYTTEQASVDAKKTLDSFWQAAKTTTDREQLIYLEGASQDLEHVSEADKRAFALHVYEKIGWRKVEDEVLVWRLEEDKPPKALRLVEVHVKAPWGDYDISYDSRAVDVTDAEIDARISQDKKKASRAWLTRELREHSSGRWRRENGARRREPGVDVESVDVLEKGPAGLTITRLVGERWSTYEHPHDEVQAAKAFGLGWWRDEGVPAFGRSPPLRPILAD